MMREIDDGVGSLLAALRGSGALDNTLLLLLSDNGAPNIFLPGEFPNFPLRGHKGDLLEGGEWREERREVVAVCKWWLFMCAALVLGCY